MPTAPTMHYVPNALTIARILLTPLVLVLLMTQTLFGQAGALVLFMCASASDYFDGRLARQMGARSRLGTFLDPLADKVLVLGTFIALAVLHPYAVPWWAVALIALRDVGVTGLRTYVEAQGYSLRTLPLAKTKTTAQLAFLIGMLVVLTATHLPAPFQEPATWLLTKSAVPLVLLLIVVVLTLGTGGLYLYYFSRAAAAPKRRSAERNSAQPNG